MAGPTLQRCSVCALLLAAATRALVASGLQVSPPEPSSGGGPRAGARSEPFGIGAAVVAHGLKHRRQYNGKRGVVQSHSPTSGTYRVYFEDGTAKRIRSELLSPAPAGTSAGAAIAVASTGTASRSATVSAGGLSGKVTSAGTAAARATSDALGHESATGRSVASSASSRANATMTAPSAAHAAASASSSGNAIEAAPAAANMASSAPGHASAIGAASAAAHRASSSSGHTVVTRAAPPAAQRASSASGHAKVARIVQADTHGASSASVHENARTAQAAATQRVSSFSGHAKATKAVPAAAQRASSASGHAEPGRAVQVDTHNASSASGHENARAALATAVHAASLASGTKKANPPSLAGAQLPSETSNVAAAPGRHAVSPRSPTAASAVHEDRFGAVPRAVSAEKVTSMLRKLRAPEHFAAHRARAGAARVGVGRGARAPRPSPERRQRRQLSRQATASRDLLPGAPELGAGPTAAFQSVSKTLSDLKIRLAASEKQGRRAVAMMRSEYERRLLEQHRNTTALKRTNKALATELLDLEERSSQFRKRAEKLRRKGSALSAELEAFSGNLSLAAEFLESSLRTDQDDSAVAVLHELDEKDEAKRNSEAHARFMAKLALLQVEGDDWAGDSDSLQSIAREFESLDSAQNESQAMLAQQYEAKAGEEARRQAVLVEAGAELSHKVEAQRELVDRLRTVVAHLEKSDGFLEKRLAALRSFAGQLGSMSIGQRHKTHRK